MKRDIVKQINNSGGLYLRYIDDILIVINWPIRHMLKQIDRWNDFDLNIQLNAQTGHAANFLDLSIENVNGNLQIKVYHKSSYEPYYLPCNSVHPIHMKRNIPYTMLLRTIKYCSTFKTYLNERERIRMALLLNKYPNGFIEEHFKRVLKHFNIDQPLTLNNYDALREKIIYTPTKEKITIDYGKTMFIHFTYCFNMRTFPAKFHKLWLKYFNESPTNDIQPILGTRNANNLQKLLVDNRRTTTNRKLIENN